MKFRHLFAAVLVVLAGALQAGPLKIGWAINDISTDKPVELAGTFHWRHSKGLRDPLMATALAIDNGDPQRWNEVYERLLHQRDNAHEWRNVCLKYFQTFSHMNIE